MVLTEEQLQQRLARIREGKKKAQENVQVIIGQEIEVMQWLEELKKEKKGPEQKAVKVKK